MSISKVTLQMAEKLRPMLVKMLPAGVLSKIKARVIYNGAKKLEKLEIAPYMPGKYPKGINLIGDIKCDTGLGQSMRLVADIIEHTGMDYTVYNYYVPPGTSMTNTSYDHKISQTVPYDINIIHVNPSEMAVAFMDLGQDKWDNRYNIGYWLWELEDFPKEWMPAFHLVDEIWTPSEFVTNVFKKYTNKPAYTIPFHVTAPVDASFDRDYFHLPKDKFLFLMMYDSGSKKERKNPLGVIAAFRQAFTGKENVGLVIKIGGMQDEAELLELKQMLDGYDNIYFVKEMLPKAGVNALIACCDVFVSLHRAEGFGLVMAEAMIVGTPCIATNWSANTEFMNKDCACMVSYTMTALKEDILPFKRGYRWAEPDIAEAAGYMKRLYEEPEFYDTMKKNAKAYIEEKLDMARISEKAKERLIQISEGKR